MMSSIFLVKNIHENLRCLLQQAGLIVNKDLLIDISIMPESNNQFQITINGTGKIKPYAKASKKRRTK